MTSYCSNACFRSSSSRCSCSKAACSACSLMTRWFSSSCFSASVVWMACCCSRCHFSSSALLADSSSNSLQQGQLRVSAPNPEDDKAQQSLRGAGGHLTHLSPTRRARGAGEAQICGSRDPRVCSELFFTLLWKKKKD